MFDFTEQHQGKGLLQGKVWALALHLGHCTFAAPELGIS
jgi:hypothetical protein